MPLANHTSYNYPRVCQSGAGILPVEHEGDELLVRHEALQGKLTSN